MTATVSLTTFDPVSAFAGGRVPTSVSELTLRSIVTYTVTIFDLLDVPLCRRRLQFSLASAFSNVTTTISKSCPVICSPEEREACRIVESLFHHVGTKLARELSKKGTATIAYDTSSYAVAKEARGFLLSVHATSDLRRSVKLQSYIVVTNGGYSIVACFHLRSINNRKVLERFVGQFPKKEYRDICNHVRKSQDE